MWAGATLKSRTGFPGRPSPANGTNRRIEGRGGRDTGRATRIQQNNTDRTTRRQTKDKQSRSWGTRGIKLGKGNEKVTWILGGQADIRVQVNSTHSEKKRAHTLTYVFSGLTKW